jgi:hypothetical protein
MSLIHHNQPAQPFWVHIEWSNHFADFSQGSHVSEYEFESESELRAFLLGLDEARGWADHRIVEASSEASFVEKYFGFKRPK